MVLSVIFTSRLIWASRGGISSATRRHISVNIAATKGGVRARLSTAPADVRAALALRRTIFRRDLCSDQDSHDDLCQHLLVEDIETGHIMACARVLHLTGACDLDRSYAAQSYDLSGLAHIRSPMLELGRFCMRPDPKATDILRAAWGQLTALVDLHDIGVLFGCTSFQGTDPAPHTSAMAYLSDKHAAPTSMPIVATGPTQFTLPNNAYDPKSALHSMPPLLRSYLAMGGWVSRTGVIDHDLGTCHVFTGLEIAKIPAARARALRAIAAVG